MQIDEKGMENLLMNMMFKNILKTHKSKKNLSMPFYLGFLARIS
jgi:hypothetical protein